MRETTHQNKSNRTECRDKLESNKIETAKQPNSQTTRHTTARPYEQQIQTRVQYRCCSLNRANRSSNLHSPSQAVIRFVCFVQCQVIGRALSHDTKPGPSAVLSHSSIPGLPQPLTGRGQTWTGSCTWLSFHNLLP